MFHRLVLGLTQPPIQWILDSCRGQENVDLYIQSSIRLQGVVFILAHGPQTDCTAKRLLFPLPFMPPENLSDDDRPQPLHYSLTINNTTVHKLSAQ
jgi:hypothetical protein